MVTRGSANAEAASPHPMRRRRPRRSSVISIGSAFLLIAFVGCGLLVFQDRSHLNDIWTWDGQDWNGADSSDEPSWRWTATYVYDERANHIVLFGGQAGEGGDSTLLGETWTWDGHWQQRHPNSSPPAREGAAAVYDPIRGNVVLFGGQADISATQLLADTWTWDGHTWHSMSTPGAPPAETFDLRSHPAAFDPKSKQVILVSQTDSTSRAIVDTWAWDGQAWTKLGSAQHLPTTQMYPGGPEISANPFLYEDSQHRRIVMLGEAVPLEWDGSKWSPVGVSSAVLVQGGDFAYDPQTAMVVSFGGYGCNMLGGGDPTTSDTWGWDGATWVQLAPRTHPPARNITYLAYDSKIRRVVMFGGYQGGTCSGGGF